MNAKQARAIVVQIDKEIAQLRADMDLPRGCVDFDRIRKYADARDAIVSVNQKMNEAYFDAVCLESIEEFGLCFLQSGGTDCDGYSHITVLTFQTIEEAKDYREQAYENADGSIGVCALTHYQYLEFENQRLQEENCLMAKQIKRLESNARNK